ncbi:MAG: zinc-ribbon domain-containing protein [Clostridia bacterium]|nr:zinc-ribbon domain-containing protein [Clostridia bacterium]
MFCPKCGTQLPDNAEFCTGCGAKLSGGVAAREEFKHLTYRERVIFALAGVLALFVLVPTVDGGFSISLLSVEAFNIHALFGVAKIFLMLALAVYVFYAVASFIDIGVPSAVKKIVMLCYLGVYSLGQLFVMIGAMAVNDSIWGGGGVTLGAAWYVMLIVLACTFVLFFVPKLIKDKK